MEEHKKMALLGSAPINRSLLALGVPTMTGMLINALYSLADAYFVGELGTDQLGAVTVAFPLGQAVVGMGLLFGNGAAARLSRLLGRGDRAGADRTASTAIYGSLLAGAAAILLSIAFLEPALRGLGAIESVMPYALSYARIYLLFSIFNVFNVAMNNVVSSEGGAKTAMWALMAGAALNVALDPLFIRVLGVAGAALATAVSQFVSTLVYLRCIRRKRSVFSFDVRSCCLRGEVLWEILKIGVPTLLFQLLTSLSIGMINSAAKEYGPSALAAMGPVTRMMSMGTLVVFGFLSPLPGSAMGRGSLTGCGRRSGRPSSGPRASAWYLGSPRSCSPSGSCPCLRRGTGRWSGSAPPLCGPAASPLSSSAFTPCTPSCSS